MIDYLKDLRPEYNVMIPKLVQRFYELHPNGDGTSCHRYVQSQILRKARKLVDYRRLERLAKADDVDVGRILLVHKSWRERPGLMFKEEPLLSVFQGARKVLDVGSGLTPLSLLKSFRDIGQYVCIEPERRLSRLLECICAKKYPGRVVVVPEKLCSVKGNLLEDRYDVVIAQKIVPMLVCRHDRMSQSILAGLNFRRMVVTGSKLSLSRTVSIEQEERSSLLSFCKLFKGARISSFENATEIGYIIG